MINRGKAFFLAVFGLSAAVGCGARTDTLFDDGTGDYGGAGDSTSTGGTVAHGGSSNPTGGSGFVAGSGPTGVSGSFGTGGTGFGTGGSSFGGSMVTAGTTSFGGTGLGTGGGVAFGGTFSTGGSLPTAGSPAGGFGAVGGEAGIGGTGGIVDACLNNAPSSCDRCLCKSCGTQINSCFADFGCALIFACVQETGCNGLACYQNATCRPIIDQFGGIAGPSVREVFSLATCVVTSGKTCGCN